MFVNLITWQGIPFHSGLFRFWHAQSIHLDATDEQPIRIDEFPGLISAPHAETLKLIPARISIMGYRTIFIIKYERNEAWDLTVSSGGWGWKALDVDPVEGITSE